MPGDSIMERIAILLFVVVVSVLVAAATYLTYEIGFRAGVRNQSKASSTDRQ